MPWPADTSTSANGKPAVSGLQPKNPMVSQRYQGSANGKSAAWYGTRYLSQPMISQEHGIPANEKSAAWYPSQ